MDIPKTKKMALSFYAAVLARNESVSTDDPRVVSAVKDATVWIAEGMRVREAVELAGVLAFRRYGQAP